MANKWQAHRAGILNYWYYDEAEFEFAGGRLMLRGSNGSGKSVTMQSLVTVLLDGVTRANRLDSFGSQSRKIEDYLLGEKELSEYEERTGYLFLEYKREASEQYVTTGIGLHARRGNGRVDFWGFVLQDGLRVGHNFELYRLGKNPETGKEERLPLTRRELETAIGTHGRVVTGQRDYMALVNQQVFGFQDIRKYEELMKLLIQLRSPKLSRDFKPTVIYEILEAALPTLSDDELRPLSETLENMQRTKLSLEQLQREKEAFDRLCAAYDGYNTALLAERGLAVQKYREIRERLARETKQGEAALKAAGEELDEAVASQQRLAAEYESLEAEREALQENEAYKTAERQQQARTELAGQQLMLDKRTRKCQEQRQKELSLLSQREADDRRADEQERLAADIMAELRDLAAEADFQADAALQREFDLQAEDYLEQLQLWQKQSQDYGRELSARRREIAAFEQRCAEAVRQEHALGEADQRLDALRQEQQKLRQMFEQMREELLRAFYEWHATWQEAMPLTEEQEMRVSSLLRSLCEDCDSTDVGLALDEIYGQQQESLSGELGRLEAKLKELAEEVALEQSELERLRSAKEAELPLAPPYAEARERLREASVPFLSFYEATEFREELDMATRERLETALMDAGVLQSVILRDNEAAAALPEDAYGSVLQAGETVLLAPSLLDYLQPAQLPPECGLSQERVAEVLGSIIVSEDGKLSQAGGSNLVLDISSGAYAVGPLWGQTAPREQALYIGRQARMAYRRQQIAELEAHLAGLQEEQANRLAVKQKLQEKRQRLAEARREFPSCQELMEAFQDVQAKDSFIGQQQELVRQLDGKLKELRLKLAACRQALQQRCGASVLPLTQSAYEEAEKAMQEYRPQLVRLESCVTGCRHARQTAARIAEDIEELRLEMAEASGERTETEMAVQKLRQLLEALSRQLEQMDAAGVEKRVAEVVARLSALPRERDAAVRRAAAAEARQTRLKEELISLGARSQLYQGLLSGWQRLLAAELERGFVFSGQEAPTEAQLQALCREWQAKSAEGEGLARAYKHMTNQFYNEQSLLADYRMQLENIGDETEAPSQAEGPWEELSLEQYDQFQAAWRELRAQGERAIIRIEMDGRRETPYAQRAWLVKHIAEQQNLLSEQDKRIYKEIIMNSIGRAISDRIYAAEDWIRKMNGLMQKSDTSSALKFRLEWKPLRGETDDELDAAELVELLHADPETLRQEDMQRLVQHFQTRIERARMVSEGEERDSESFQMAVRELLDYRHWFRFQLFYDKGEQIKRRELTDRAFFSFSGGEKAMAMYVPLFSAAYSRYMDAAPDAPCLITLDEAFAGVDEQNMRDMFRLVEAMGFNYIMNSQAIWGDYDVVPELNIYELLRPLNANYVTLYGTHWNGERRELLVPEKEQGDDAEE